MKNLIIITATVLFSINAHAYVITKIERSVVMPHLEKSIQTLCLQSKQHCVLRQFKVTGLIKNDFSETEIKEVATAAFTNQFTEQADINIIGRNASQLGKVKSQAAAVSQAAEAYEAERDIEALKEVQVQIYKLAVKGNIYFAGGNSSSRFGARVVFAAIRLSNNEEEAEILAWDGGFAQ